MTAGVLLEVPSPRSRSLRPAPAVFLFFAAFFALTSTGRVRTIDEVMTLFQAESIVLRGSIAVPQAVATGTFYGTYDVRGEPRAPYPPGHALAAAPFYALGRFLLVRALVPGARLTEHPFGQDRADLVLAFAATLSSAAFAALCATLAFLVLRALDIEERPALAATAIFALATPVFSYSGFFFSEPLAGALLLAAALAIARESSTRRAALCGLLLGAAVWVRPVHVIAAPAFVLAILVRDGRRGVRPALALAASLSVIVAGLLAYDAVLFGDPLELGYPRTAEGGKRLNSFETPLARGLLGFLLSPGKSVFLFAPPLVVAIAGVRPLAKRDRAIAALACLMPLGYLAFFARYTQWEGGYCFGPRYLVPPLCLALLGLGPALADGGPRLRRVALLLAAAGFLVQALGLSTSFLEAEVGSHRYYDGRYDYRLDYDALAEQARLLLRYAASREPAALGLGFDRWFVMLEKGGVSRLALAAICSGLALTCAGALLAVLQRWPFSRPSPAESASSAHEKR